jgi:hypothetical protein
MCICTEKKTFPEDVIKKFSLLFITTIFIQEQRKKLCTAPDDDEVIVVYMVAYQIYVYDSSREFHFIYFYFFRAAVVKFRPFLIGFVCLCVFVYVCVYLTLTSFFVEKIHEFKLFIIKKGSLHCSF